MITCSSLPHSFTLSHPHSLTPWPPPTHRGPSDITLADKNTSRLSVSNLHIDEEEGSPTLYAFQLQVTDHKKLTNEDVAFVEYHKGGGTE